MKKIYFLALIFTTHFAFNQTQVNLHFSPKVESLNFNLGDTVNINGKKASINYFNYYISNLHIIYNGGQDLDLSDSVFLVKHQNHSLDLGMLNVSNIEKIAFGVGVPQDLNHLDISTYPENHPLSFQDPSMHWGWTSGYTHMIVGGNADSNLDENPDAYFEIHNIGDGNYYLVEVVCNEINTNSNQKDIYINCNLDTWLGLTDLGTVGIKHGETGTNFLVMKNLTLRPVFSFPANASLETISDFTGKVYASKENLETKITWKDITSLDIFSLIDSNGKLIKEEKVKNNSDSIILANFNNGIYFMNFYSKEGKLLNQLKVIL